MSENLETETKTPQASAQEIQETIAELEKYRERLVNDIREIGKKVKLPKKQVEAQLQESPELLKVDAALENLRSHQATI